MTQWGVWSRKQKPGINNLGYCAIWPWLPGEGKTPFSRKTLRMKISAGVFRRSQEEQWHRKPGDSSALAKISWQGGSQDVARGLAELWQGQHSSGTHRTDSRRSANAQQSLCATLPCQWDSAVTCQQIFTCHSSNNVVKQAQSTGRERVQAAPQSFGAGFVCL